MVLGAFLNVLISPFGMLFFLFGLVQFLLCPMIPRVTNHFHGLARLHLWLAANMLKRASIVVSEHGDLILKRMSPDDIGTETISFQDDTKEFEDQNERNAKSTWMGIPFAMADEVHGFLFTPLDAAIGARKAHAERHDEMVVKGTAREREMFDVMGWVRGVLEFPKDEYELVDLNEVRQLVSGGERAEHPQRVEKWYELSREPYQDGTSATKMIMIIAAIIGPFAALWVLSSQMGLSGGSGPSSTVSFGLLYLLFGFDSLTSVVKSIDWKRVIVSAIVLLPLPITFIGVLLLTSPLYATLLFVVMGMGFWLLPLLIQIFKISTGATNKMAGLLLKTGFFGYKEPVFEYSPRGYRIREFNKLNTSSENITWHSFLGRKFGFTFTPSAAVHDAGVVQNPSKLENRALSDGGCPTNIPAGYQRIPERTRAVYGDFIPNKLNKDTIYVRTGIALERMKNVATGEKSHKRLTKAKEEFGGTTGISETSIMYAVVACALVSFVSGIGVFILPAFL